MEGNLFPPPPSARFSLPQGRQFSPPGAGQLIPLPAGSVTNPTVKPLQVDDQIYGTREWVVKALPGPAAIAAMKAAGSVATWGVGLQIQCTEGAAQIPLNQPVNSPLAALTSLVIPICGGCYTAHGNRVSCLVMNFLAVAVDVYLSIVPGPGREYFSFGVANGTPIPAPDFAQGFSAIVNGNPAAGDTFKYEDPSGAIITTVDPSIDPGREWPWDPFSSQVLYQTGAGAGKYTTVRWRCLS